MEVQALIAKLSKYYWPKSPPESFTVKHPVSGASVGLGVIAHKSYAAFNLTVAIYSGKLSSIEQHVEACGTFGSIRYLLERPDAVEVEGMITLLSFEEFRKWYLRNAAAVPQELRPWIEDALTNYKPEVHKV